MTGFDEQPSVVEVPKPEAGPGEVRVRVRAASLNGFDLSVAAGRLKGMLDYQFPLILGKDFAGTIDAVGEGVSRFAVSDPVFGLTNKPDFTKTGSFAEFLVVPEDSAITRLPAGLDLADAGAIGLAGVTALQSVDAMDPKPGQAVLVSGATGGVGTFAVQIVAARGAEVIATAKGDEADFLRELGATHVVDYTGDLAAQVRGIRPDGVDAVLHFAGDGIELADLVRPGGRLASTMGVGQEQMAGRDVTATSVMNNPDAAKLDRLAAEIAAGRLRVPIQQTYPLDQVGQAMADFKSGTRGKLAIAI
jgi:NADPH:quinone reductase-like Zn-dependent oxidoreductase